MDIDIAGLKKKKSLHNIKPRKNKMSSLCKKEEHFSFQTNRVKFCLAFGSIVLLMPFIFLKEIDVYLEESMLGGSSE